MTSYFPSAGFEEGWLGGVVRDIHADFTFFKLCEIEKAQLRDTLTVTTDPVMRESFENRLREIDRTMEIRRGRQEDAVRNAVEQLETTEAMRKEKLRLANLDAMTRRTAAQEVLAKAGRDLDTMPQPTANPVPAFLRT